jgi:8-oxo-dGTP pyrophosphatase MutT (NUDIX family)
MPHIHEKVDLTVETFIVNDNAVLLRKHDKYGIWLGVGGHVELDEDPVEAAIREAKEEVGLDIDIFGEVKSFDGEDEGKEILPPRFINRHKVNLTHEHVALVYFATVDDRNIIPSVKEHSEGIRWCTKEELVDMPLKKHIRHYVQEALRVLAS